jgi:hypothetical protein
MCLGMNSIILYQKKLGVQRLNGSPVVGQVIAMESA